jgi:hypothetical protein
MRQTHELGRERSRTRPGLAGRLGKATAAPIVFAALGLQLSCAGTTGPPSQTRVTVSVTPASASVFLGATQQFQSIVSGSSDTAVTWEVNGAVGGAANTGMISATGFYTAPAVMPAGGGVTITAVSDADAADSGSARVTLEDDIAISVAPPTANVPSGGAQVFTATMMSGSGDPAAGFNWSVNGIAGGNSTVGTIVTTSATTALYTAPPAPPSPATVTATSVADGTKSGSAMATITCAATDSISPSPASVGLGASQTFTASLCVPAGSALAWDVNGIAGGSAAVGTIAPSGSSAAIYTAPTDLPAANPVTIHAAVSPQPAGGPEIATASVMITSGVSVSVSAPTATIGLGQRTSFSATVMNSADATVTWSVAGVLNGNASVGQICVSGSNPCVAPAGAGAVGVDYLAPASVPAVNPELVTATSHADASKSGSATVTISGPTGEVSVTVTPAYAFVVPSGGVTSTFQFSAAVSGSANTAVNWSVASAVAGQGCGGAACGSVNASGLYSAPPAAPSPNAISVIATSQADPTKSAASTIAISSGPMIEVMLPSSVMAGAAEGFPLELQGTNFVAGSGGAASTILINGAARATTCATGAQCVTALNPSDVASAGALTVEVQNPGKTRARFRIPWRW